MSSVFRKGDVVYHPRYGKVSIQETGSIDSEVYSGEYGVMIIHNILLSFTPWPAPCHERPFTEVGWWIGQHNVMDGGENFIRWREDKSAYRVTKTGPGHQDKGGWKWIKFLGKEIE